MDLVASVLVQLGSVMAGVWILTEWTGNRIGLDKRILAVAFGAIGALLFYAFGALPGIEEVVKNAPFAPSPLLRFVAALTCGALGGVMTSAAHALGKALFTPRA